jgi:asparagine synthetase B (glutamine-hydrolysing)
VLREGDSLVMCGICGVWRFDGGPIEEGVLRIIPDVMVHRGPDDEGLYVADGTGLGHCWLSMIDLCNIGRWNENLLLWLLFPLEHP